MFIIAIYAILLWIYNLNHHESQMNISQKQFKDQQMQIDVLKQTAYYPVYNMPFPYTMQQYGAEELVFKCDNVYNYLPNIQQIKHLFNLKRMRITSGSKVVVDDACKVDFQDAIFPKLTELEIIGINVTGNFDSVQHVTLSHGYLADYYVLPYADLIKSMTNLKTVKIYHFGTRITDRICYTNYAQPSYTTYIYSDECVKNVKEFSKIIEFCINNGINVTEIENCRNDLICQL